MDVLRIGASGLLAAAQAVDARAENIVSADVPDFSRQTPVFSPIVSGGVAVLMTQNTDSPLNPLLEALGLRAAAQQYSAAASLVRTGEELSATLLQTIA